MIKLFTTADKYPMIQEMACDMKTNFSTNLREHAPSRIKKLFKYLWDKKEGRRMINYLM